MQWSTIKPNVRPTSVLNTENVGSISFEMSYQTARYHNPEEYSMNIDRPENWHRVLLNFEARQYTALNIVRVLCVVN